MAAFNWQGEHPELIGYLAALGVWPCIWIVAPAKEVDGARASLHCPFAWSLSSQARFVVAGARLTRWRTMLESPLMHSSECM